MLFDKSARFRSKQCHKPALFLLFIGRTQITGQCEVEVALFFRKWNLPPIDRTPRHCGSFPRARLTSVGLFRVLKLWNTPQNGHSSPKMGQSGLQGILVSPDIQWISRERSALCSSQRILLDCDTAKYKENMAKSKRKRSLLTWKWAPGRPGDSFYLASPNPRGENRPFLAFETTKYARKWLKQTENGHG